MSIDDTKGYKINAKPRAKNGLSSG